MYITMYTPRIIIHVAMELLCIVFRIGLYSVSYNTYCHVIQYVMYIMIILTSFSRIITLVASGSKPTWPVVTCVDMIATSLAREKAKARLAMA